MADLPTRIDLFNIGADDIFRRAESRPASQRINPEEVFTEGSDINLITASASAMAEEVVRQLALQQAMVFLDTAEGEDLDRLIRDRISEKVVRKGATPAVVPVTFSRLGGTLDAITLEAGFKVRTTGGIEFRTRFSASIAAGQLGPSTVTAEAVEAGLAGRADVGTITEFADTPPDPALRVTNNEAAAGGDDEERDPTLRERARDFYSAIGGGTLPSIRFGALTVPGVRQATAIEGVDPNGDPNGRVSLFIADAQGQGNSALINAVRGALLEYRAAGISVDIFSSTPVFQAIRYRLRFQTGTDNAEAFASIQFATLAAVNALQPNETLEVSLLFELARAVPGVIVLEDAIVDPIGDIVPLPGEVIRTRLDLITVE